MKIKRLKLSSGIVRISSILLLMAVFTRCTGPMGPQGHDGQNGLDGINYTHSVIYDIAPTEWIGNADGYYKEIIVPEITDNIYYTGAVLVYMLVEIDPKSFNLLPYTSVDKTLSIYWDFDVYVGSINFIHREVDNGVNVTLAPPNIMSFKVVIIEGIQLTALKTKVNINDFDAVSKFLNIDKGHSNIK